MEGSLVLLERIVAVQCVAALRFAGVAGHWVDHVNVGRASSHIVVSLEMKIKYTVFAEINAPDA